jgi:putative redox protein
MKPITVRSDGPKMRQTIAIRGHRLVSDVDAEDGGEDAGPSPHELLAAALGSCTALTLRMYARRKGWPLEDAVVTVGIEHPEGGGSVFLRELALAGTLDESQRKRLLQVAEACPVHKTLSSRIEIRTRLV